jgi:hypothetical protein
MDPEDRWMLRDERGKYGRCSWRLVKDVSVVFTSKDAGRGQKVQKGRKNVQIIRLRRRCLQVRRGARVEASAELLSRFASALAP